MHEFNSKIKLLNKCLRESAEYWISCLIWFSKAHATFERNNNNNKKNNRMHFDDEKT